jgi:hypothetical protein
MPCTSAQLAVAIVSIVEKVTGTGFDPLTDSILVDEIATLLEEEVDPDRLMPFPTWE